MSRVPASDRCLTDQPILQTEYAIAISKEVSFQWQNGEENVESEVTPWVLTNRAATTAHDKQLYKQFSIYFDSLPPLSHKEPRPPDQATSQDHSYWHLVNTALLSPT